MITVISLRYASTYDGIARLNGVDFISSASLIHSLSQFIFNILTQCKTMSPGTVLVIAVLVIPLDKDVDVLHGTDEEKLYLITIFKPRTRHLGRIELDKLQNH